MSYSRARNYGDLTLKRLFSRSGNQCAFPGCSIELLGPEEDGFNVSNICHIEDAKDNPNKRTRYNPNMTDKERADYKNLIVLCATHHLMTNDIDRYTVVVLKKMKKDHEEMIRKKVFGDELITFSRNESALAVVIKVLGKHLFDNSTESKPITAPNPITKITYNNVIAYAPLIEDYRVYQGKIRKSYEEIERHGSSRKEFVLKNINTLYLQEKGKFGTRMEDIRKNADTIFANVENELWNILDKEEKIELPYEAINISLKAIMVDAFFNCDILEEPTKQ